MKGNSKQVIFLVLAATFASICTSQPIVTGSSKVLQVSTGEGHTCAIVSGGYLFCVGESVRGQCGGGVRRRFLGVSYVFGNNKSSFSRVDLGTGRSAKQVVAGAEHTCVILESDHLKCFGYNQYGQLGLTHKRNFRTGVLTEEMGDGLPEVELPEVDRSGPITVKQVAAGRFHTCVLLLDNHQVVCFGRNHHGQLGQGTLDKVVMAESAVAVNVGKNRSVKQVAVGFAHTCVLLDNHEVKCFGRNDYSQLGNGMEDDIGKLEVEMGDNLKAIGFGGKVKKVTAGEKHTCVLLVNNQVQCVGEPTSFSKSGRSDGRIQTLSFDSPRYAKDVYAGAYHTCVVLDNSQVTCFGEGTWGQLGNGNVIEDGQTVDLGEGRTVKQMALGWEYTCAVLDNDYLKCFGRNTYGQLGTGNTQHQGLRKDQMGNNLPYVNFGLGTPVKQIATGRYHTCVLFVNDQIKCLGYNWDGKSFGEAVGDMGDSLPYIPIGTGETVKEVVAGGYHTCVLLHSERLKCFGWNGRGQLGLGDLVYRGLDASNVGDELPYVDVGEGRLVKQVAAGRYHTCVLLDNNDVKCFGRVNGRTSTPDIGIAPGDMGDYLRPINSEDTTPVKQVAAGEDHTCVLFENGKVKCFGSIFGVWKHTVDRHSYVQLGGKATYIEAGNHHFCVMLETSQVECLGKNDKGQLGLGDTKYIYEIGPGIPTVDLGDGVRAKRVTVGSEHTCILLEDGRVTCTGLNNYGQLGYNTTDGENNNQGDEPGEEFVNLESIQLWGDERKVKNVFAGGFHTCLLLESGHATCFGRNNYGQLGLSDKLDRDSVPSWPIDFGFNTYCIPGTSFEISGTTCTKCKAGEFQALPNQLECEKCPIGYYQDEIGSTSCKPCLPGTFQNEIGSESCHKCSIGTYEEEHSSTRCRSCPLQHTTTEVGSDRKELCVAAPGFLLLPPAPSRGIRIRSCNDIIGGDCSKPGATVENLPLDCGYWRPNPFDTQRIQQCPGGCNSCRGGNRGQWITEPIHQFHNSTKYCNDGHVGPRCSLCQEGFADIYRNNSCIKCTDVMKTESNMLFNYYAAAWAVGISALTILYPVVLKWWRKNENSKKGESRSWFNCSCLQNPCMLNFHFFTLVTSTGSVFTNLVSFFQVLNAYTSEFSNLNAVWLWDFNVDPFSTIMVMPVCQGELSFRAQLILHAIAPIGVGLWILVLTKLINCFYPDEERQHTNYAFALFAALFPVNLALPSVGRRAVSSFVCESFEISDSEDEEVWLLVADMRTDCFSDEHIVTKLIAGMILVVYALVPCIFLYAWAIRVPQVTSKESLTDTDRGYSERLNRLSSTDEMESNERSTRKSKRGLLKVIKSMLIESSFRNSFGWYLGYDTFRKFIQASFIVFFVDGTLGQVQISAMLNLVAIAIAFTCLPFNLPGGNLFLLIQLHILLLVCQVAGFYDVSNPLDEWQKTLIETLAFSTIPFVLLCCAYNIYVLQNTMKAVQEASEKFKNEQTKNAYDGLKKAHQNALRLGLKEGREMFLKETGNTLRETENVYYFTVNEGVAGPEDLQNVTVQTGNKLRENENVYSATNEDVAEPVRTVVNI